jgi:hypothetical protein
MPTTGGVQLAGTVNVLVSPVTARIAPEKTFVVAIPVPHLQLVNTRAIPVIGRDRTTAAAKILSSVVIQELLESVLMTVHRRTRRW